MSTLLEILAFIICAVVVVGLINPAWLKDRKTGETPKRKELIAAYFVGVGTLYGISLAIGSPLFSAKSEASATTTVEQTENQVSKPVEKESAPVQEKKNSEPVESLGLTPEQFRTRFNEKISAVDSDLKLAELDIIPGEVKTFKRNVGKLGMVGAVNDDGTLRDIILILGGGGDVDNMKAMIGIVVAAQSIDTETPKKEMANMVMKMISSAAKDIEKGKTVTKKHGKFTYSASASTMTGIMFTIGQ